MTCLTLKQGIFLLLCLVYHETVAFLIHHPMGSAPRPASTTSALWQAPDGSAGTTSGGSTPFRGSSSLPPRRPKASKKKKKGGRRQGAPNRQASITEQDLAEHVSSLYIHGPGGVLSENERKRHRQSKYQSVTTRNKSNGRAPVFRDDSKVDSNTNDEATQWETIRKLDRHPALLLNADFQPMSYLPLSLWSWQESVKAVFSGKVQVVDVYPDVTIRAANLEVPVPSVIALTEYVPQYSQTPAFTKRNVFLRDEYRCQYCSDLFHTRDLSLDHVFPRSKGGRLQWTNAVTCCRKCNGRKGSLELHEVESRLGMKLLKPPRIPSQYELAKVASRMLPRRVHPTWEPYLGMHFPASTTETPTATQHQHQQEIQE